MAAFTSFSASRTVQRKFFRRITTVLLNSLNNLLLPVFNVIISSLVVRQTSADLWGGFVSVLIVVQLGAHVVYWGNKAYLLREFSFHPNQIKQNWQISLLARMVLFILVCCLLAFSGFTFQRSFLVVLWGFGLVIAQSFEVLVLYRKDFRFAIILEASATAILILSVLILGHALTVDQLITLYASMSLLKACALGLRFQDIGCRFSIQFDMRYFRLATPFFLLGFSGMLASRIDLYAVNFVMTDQDVAQYQIFINLMLYLQALSAFIVMPFLKNLYRMGDPTFQRLSLRLFAFGLLLIIPALLAVHQLLIRLYGIHFLTETILLGGLFVVPVYGYLPFVHRLYKLNWQNTVLVINIIGAGVNLVLNLVLLPHMGITGAILASALIQWGMLIFYSLQFRGTYEDSVSNLSHPI